MRRTFLAFATAVVLAASLAGPALGATATSTSTVTATVLSSITIAGVPPTMNLGSGIAGATLVGTPFDITVTSSETDFTVSASSTGFTGGGGDIPASAVKVRVGSTDFPMPGPVVIANNVSPNVTVKMFLPADAKKGTYTGTVTFTAAN